ncbi:hypothetical protein KCZ48_01820 [Lactiplantibacillus plantarum]|uniref:hypothetical protein n=1 Tax=Lactiplantibacillus plantarum TaxID=1590 RepID=UPI00200D581F|nr:hypothetical protein [Lactiplantibacillus plantarum]UQB61507.1 hypothetical protein KCZ48_01820 [Lactiplantibacillus plantarum]
MLINFSKLDIVTIILNKKGNILWWGNRRQASRAWIIILIIAVLTILPIILNQVGVLGVDSYFQYNRIYEAEMQIRHGNFSFLNGKLQV